MPSNIFISFLCVTDMCIQPEQSPQMMGAKLVSGPPNRKVPSLAYAAFPNCSKEVNLPFNVHVGETKEGSMWSRWSTTLTLRPCATTHRTGTRNHWNHWNNETIPGPPHSDENSIANEDYSDAILCAFIHRLRTSIDIRPTLLAQMN